MSSSEELKKNVTLASTLFLLNLAPQLNLVHFNLYTMEILSYQKFPGHIACEKIMILKKNSSGILISTNYNLPHYVYLTLQV